MTLQLLKPRGKHKHSSISDRFPLKPTGEHTTHSSVAVCSPAKSLSFSGFGKQLKSQHPSKMQLARLVHEVLERHAQELEDGRGMDRILLRLRKRLRWFSEFWGPLTHALGGPNKSELTWS